MKFCTHCGSQLPDDASFCSKCGTRQPENSHISQNQQYQSAPGPSGSKPTLIMPPEGASRPTQIAPPPSQRRPAPRPGDGNNKKLLYAVIAVVAVLLIGGGVWIFLDRMAQGNRHSKSYSFNYNSENEGGSDYTGPTAYASSKNKTENKETVVAAEDPRPSINYNGVNYLKGKIDGKYKVNMVLDLGSYSGKYSYDKYGPKNSMTISVEEKSGNYVVLEEYNKHGEYCGEWRGTLKNGRYKGTGTFNGKDMPFDLTIISASESPY